MDKQELVYKRQIEGVEGGLPSRLPAVCLAVVAFAVATLVLGSNALLNWVNNLPIGPVSDFLLGLAQGWQNFLSGIGVTRFAASLNAWLTGFQAIK